MCDKIITNLKDNKSTGNDGLSTKFIKQIKEPLIKPLTIIINQWFSTNIFPQALKIAKVIPLYK